MTTLISVDPGLRHCGVAVWEGKKLARAFLVRNLIQDTKQRGPSVWSAMGSEVHLETPAHCHLAIEYPQAYQLKFQKGDQNDLVELAGVVGAVCSYWPYGAVKGYLPAAWKGQVEKSVMVNRIKGRLSREENDALENTPASLIHNVYDAIGIGLFHLGRL